MSRTKEIERGREREREKEKSGRKEGVETEKAQFTNIAFFKLSRWWTHEKCAGSIMYSGRVRIRRRKVKFAYYRDENSRARASDVLPFKLQFPLIG